MAHGALLMVNFMILKNVSRYYPEEMPFGNGVQYFQCADGQDFYESMDKFTARYKLCIDPGSAVIRSFAEDVSTLYPAGFDIAETDVLPDGFSINGDWQFVGGKVVPRVYTPAEQLVMDTNKRDMLMTAASARITALTEAQEDDDITPEEVAELGALRSYRVSLRRLELVEGTETVWPDNPALSSKKN